LAIGACSGRVLIHDANSLKQIATITEVIDPDKETLSILKFSPNSELLAVTYSPPVNEIVFYSTKSWKRVKTISGVVRTRVMCLDYSVDGKYI
jgi:microtubule-associated protein-like 6